jgi:hypothetical protein
MRDSSCIHHSRTSGSNHKEIVTVTAKQYLAVAENVLQTLFPDLPLSSFSDRDERSSFAVYIKDDDDAYVERRTHSC